MTFKEKKLTVIFLILLAISVITQVIPFAINKYQSDIHEIEQLQRKISQLEKIQARSQYWQSASQRTKRKEQLLLKQLFMGQSPELVAARVQEKLKTLAQQNDIKVESMSLPDLKESHDWLLINQSMSFKASSENLMRLLGMIKKSKPALIVTDIQIRSYGQLLNCTLKVVGFSQNVSNQENEL